MQDKALFSALIDALHQGFIAQNISNIEIYRNYQPRLQGRKIKPHILLVKLYDKRVGQPYKKNIYREDTQDFLHQEIQQMESTIEISAFQNEVSFHQNNSQNALTASDLCNLASIILANDKTLETLGRKHLRPIHFSPIKNPHFENQNGVYEASPSFELVVSHQHIFENIIEAAKTIKGNFA